MTIIAGLVITLGCLLGGFVAMGGHVHVIWQPWEYVIICGSALGTFVVGNPIKTIKDTGKALVEGFMHAVPKKREYLDLLGILYVLMRELRSKSRNEIEPHIDAPDESPIFQRFPSVLGNRELLTFLCDYCRLIIMGNARTHEIESLMDEEIHIYVATGLSDASADADEEERIEVVAWALDRLDEAIERSKDSKTLIGLLLLKERLARP